MIKPSASRQRRNRAALIKREIESAIAEKIDRATAQREKRRAARKKS